MRPPDAGAVRLVLAPFPLFALYLGLGYILGDARRFGSTSFAAAKRLGRLVTDGDPMNFWGIVFLIGAIVLTWALMVGSNQWLALGMFVGGSLHAFWAFLFTISAIADPNASPNGPGVYGFIAAVHFTGAWWLWVKRS